MSPDNHLHFAVSQLAQDFCPFHSLQSALQKSHGIGIFCIDPACVEVMLLGQNLCWNEKGRLITILHGNSARFQSNDCFTASNIALKQPIHRDRTAEIVNDFLENSLLSPGGMKGQNTLDGFSDSGARLEPKSWKLP